MASLDTSAEGLPIAAQIGLGTFFVFALAALIIMRNPRRDLEEAIRQDP